MAIAREWLPDLGSTDKKSKGGIGSSVKLLFLDESGDHLLQKIDSNCPIFVLGGLIFDRQVYRTVIEPGTRDLKNELLGETEIILHASNISISKHWM